MADATSWSPAPPGSLITLQQVEALSNGFTAALADLDIAGARIGIAIADQPQYMAALRAIRARGGVATLMYSAAPTPRTGVELGQRIQRSEPLAVITDTTLEPVIAEQADPSVGLLVVHSEGPKWVRRPLERARITCQPEATMMVFTSGSTAMPKGVLLSHANVDFVMRAHREILNWTSRDTYLACLPLTHVLGIVNLTSILAAGGRAIVSPGFMFPDRVIETCREQRVSVMSLVPYFLSRLLAQKNLVELPSLRQVTVSSAPIVKTDISLLKSKLPDVNVLHTYGLTEAFRSTMLEPEHVPDRLPSIGRPIDGVELELRSDEGDKLDDPQATGVAWLRGPNVMLGYFNQPDATAAAIRDGWLCTADIMQRSADGFYTLKGRTAEVLNGGGEKLMCHEVEALIFRSLKVEELVVLSVSSHQGCDHVVAVLAPQPGTQPALVDVRRACVGQVHSVFIPKALVCVDKLPRRENGKIDRASVARIALEYLADLERGKPTPPDATSE